MMSTAAWRRCSKHTAGRTGCIQAPKNIASCLRRSEDALKLGQFFDVSGIASVLRETVAGEGILQLREVLDQLTFPAMTDIPDGRRWPGWRRSVGGCRTPKSTSFVENGPHAGEFLVSADTVDRLPEYYARVKDLPYRSGPAAQLYEVYRTISHGGSTTIHDAFLSSPIGLSYIIPPRWMLGFAGLGKGSHRGCCRVAMAGSELWPAHRRPRCLCSHRAGRRRVDDTRNTSAVRWRALLVPLAIIFVAGLLAPLFTALLDRRNRARRH